MKRLVALVALITAFAIAGPAYAAVQVAITSPASGAHSLGGIVPVKVTASADMGIYAVQLNVDGVATGGWITATTGLYQYELAWNTAGVAIGNHTLSVTAIDWSRPFPLGVLVDSSPVTVDVGPAYPTITLTSPRAWSTIRGSVALAETHTSAVDPSTVAFAVDGVATTSPWNTALTNDGTHTIAATVTDGRGKQGTATETVTVDNTPPATYVMSAAANASLPGTVTAKAHASDAYGIANVQFRIDGNAVGAPVALPDASGGYTYSATLNVTGLANGSHTLTSVATDNAGNTTTSAPFTFTIGVSPLAATITAPPDWSYARGTVSITGAVTGGIAPYSTQLLVDGVASGTAVASSNPSFAWNTTAATAGSHTVAVKATDATGTTATSTPVHLTVDNTPATAVIYKPAPSARVTGVTSLQVHASDANGVKSVQFTVDGSAVGALLSAPDSGQAYLYTISYDTSVLAAGTHAVSAIVIDNAGNTATAAPISMITGALAVLPVLNYHGIDPASGNSSIYDQTLAEADQQLAYLKTNGYQSVTLEQYQTWLGSGALPAGVTKPVLITVDDALTEQLAWDGLLAKYGFQAVMFVITGFADNTTPGDADPERNLTWAQIQALAANGRWQIAFHAGQYGHGDDYTVSRIGTARYTAACPYFYTCLNFTGTGRSRINETPAAYEAAVTAEVNAGIAELKANVPTASLVAWAAPFNDAGQWTNLYNDPTGTVQAWFPGFMASKFPVVFTQTNPVTYAQASGTVGSLSGFNRRYRFEVHTDTTLAQFAAALADPGFAR